MPCIYGILIAERIHGDFGESLALAERIAMGITWLDVSLLTLLFSLGAVLITQSIFYLSRRDAQEARRNRQAACQRHEWVRKESIGLVCRLCGKIPG